MTTGIKSSISNSITGALTSAVSRDGAPWSKAKESQLHFVLLGKILIILALGQETAQAHVIKASLNPLALLYLFHVCIFKYQHYHADQRATDPSLSPRK